MGDLDSTIDSTIESSQAFLQGGWFGVIATALVILVVTLIAAEVLVRVFRKAYHITRDGDKAGSIISVALRVVVWACGAYMLFKNCFDIDLSVVIGALGIGGLALSLGMQDTIKNLLGGLQITFSHEINIGDWITVGSVEGIVTDVNLRYTTLEDDIGQTHVIPNSVINSSIVTRKPEFFRVPLALTLARDIDLSVESPKICAIADAALDEKGMRFPEKPSIIVEAGVGADGVQATLAVFSTWEFSGVQVKSTVLSPVVQYLQENNLIGRWS
ncbi:MAG: mechanosensitive ion channel family protein [Coriobacteriales bacterium]